MSLKAPHRDFFVLTAFDRDQWRPVLQTRFQADDLEALRSVLGAAADDDPDLRHKQYRLEEDEWRAIVDRFAIPFDPSPLRCQRRDIFLHREQRIATAPYLIHAGYELPLLLDGRKQLARMSDGYPPERFEGEDRFDHWVAAGVLSKFSFTEPFDRPSRRWLGHRTVYYTRSGEEWRVPAMRMLLTAPGGWNQHFERLEGMLFGYTDAENDWWIELVLQGGGFGGMVLFCAVSSAGLAWIETAGYRALPSPDGPMLSVWGQSRDPEADPSEFLFANPRGVAFVRFNVPGRHLMDVVDLRTSGPWDVPAEHIPVLNQHLQGSVVVVARRAG